MRICDDHLFSGPIWTGLQLTQAHRRHTEQRLLDLRTGTLVRLGDEGTRFRSMRFVSAASPHAMAFRAEALASTSSPVTPFGPLGIPREFVREDGGEIW